MNLSCYTDEGILRILQGWERDMLDEGATPAVTAAMLQTSAWCTETLKGLEDGTITYDKAREDMSALLWALLPSPEDVLEVAGHLGSAE